MKEDIKILSKQCVRKAEEEGYASLMNDTKWLELCFAFAIFERKPAWRTYDFLTGYLSRWDCDWFEHVGPVYVSIEWLEIDAKDCNTAQIRNILTNVGVPFEEKDYFKVFGYRKSSSTESLSSG